MVSAFKDAFNDLSAHYNHDAVTIGDEEYLLFDVPADHQCLFYSIAAVSRPLYKGKSPTLEEVRKGVIVFYQSCSGKLKVIFDTEWPGVSTMAGRAKILIDDPNEWGEHMDIQAAAIFFNVDIKVVTQTTTSQVYVEEVHLLQTDGKRRRDARKCSRVIYYDGRSHFKVEHKLLCFFQSYFCLLTLLGWTLSVLNLFILAD